MIVVVDLRVQFNGESQAIGKGAERLMSMRLPLKSIMTQPMVVMTQPPMGGEDESSRVTVLNGDQCELWPVLGLCLNEHKLTSHGTCRRRQR